MATTSSNQARLLLHGGDTMLGRAVQLTFPFQAANDELIQDSRTAGAYLLMALHCPPSNVIALASHELERIRETNRDGSYLWGNYLSVLKICPPPDVRLLNLENAVTASTTNYDVPLKGINYHMHAKNLPLVFDGFAAATYADDGEEEAEQNSPRPVPYVISMANNNAMDFGHVAFEQETLPAVGTLPGDGHVVGIGNSILEAAKAARIMLSLERESPYERHCHEHSLLGTPPSWRATSIKSGMVVLPALDTTTAIQKAVEFFYT